MITKRLVLSPTALLKFLLQRLRVTGISANEARPRSDRCVERDVGLRTGCARDRRYNEPRCVLPLTSSSNMPR